jgi:hypothetical protein
MALLPWQMPEQPGGVSQPTPPVTVFPLIVLIVRTPLLIAPYPVCVPPLSVATVTTLVPEPLLSLIDYCLPFTYCSLYFVYPLIVLRLYCLAFPIVSEFLLFCTLYCLLGFTALDGLDT